MTEVGHLFICLSISFSVHILCLFFYWVVNLLLIDLKVLYILRKLTL